MSIHRRAFLAATVFLGSVVSARVAVAADLAKESIRENGIVAEFHYAANARRRTTVIMLNGSDGGVPSARDAADLAASGFTVLALAYFRDWNGHPSGLPASLQEIPLEYFFQAIDWLKRRPQVDGGRIVLMGQSRGAELALLLATLMPEIAGVVAFSPSAFVWHGVAAPGVPAWTLHGRPVPYRVSAIDNSLPPFEWFARAAPMATARIRVEDIRGPVMLISSRDDRIWPAAAYADEIVSARASRGRPVTNLQFYDASHLLMGTGPGITTFQIPGTTITLDFGGTPGGNARARQAAWRATRQFLAAF